MQIHEKILDERQMASVMGNRVRELLEDFHIVANVNYITLMPEFQAEILSDNIQAAIIATQLNLQSIDYAKKRYCNNNLKNLGKKRGKTSKYINAYKSAKRLIEKEISKLPINKIIPPPNGVFGASIVLQRLRSSFFSAHLLYRLGNEYEAHAVARLILEQIAWAYTAYSLDDLNAIKNIKTTKTVSELKKILPDSALLYGFLSKKTHIAYDNHLEFLQVEDGETVILLSQDQYYEYAKTILTLADMFSVVWEISQFDYIKKPETVEKKGNIFLVRDDRPFLRVMEKHLRNIHKG